jgi:ATP-dependent Clp protease protease subunit
MREESMSQNIQSRYVLPTIEERTTYGYKRLDPYTKLFEERIIFLGQAIDDTVANDVMAQILTLESMDPDRDIIMYINSPGGSFTALTAIYDTMQFVRPDVMTICLGQAASAAAVLLAGGTKGKRYALEHSRILIHQPYSEGGGQGSDIEIQAREILRMRTKVVIRSVLLCGLNGLPTLVQKKTKGRVASIVLRPVQIRTCVREG